MKLARIIAVLLLSVVACSARGSSDDPLVDRDAPRPNGGDAGDLGDAAADAASDAERPLVCGGAGFCETRMPTSDLGLPLSLRSVWVVASNDVWSVSAEGFVLHYDGTGWTVELRANHSLSSVWATSTSVWVGGEAGLILRRAPERTWLPIESGHTSMIRSITGKSDDEVWFVDDDGVLLRFDGAAIAPHSVGVPNLRATTVFARSNLGIYAAGYVPGPSPEEAMTASEAYLLELGPAGATVFNAKLRETKGFVPTAAAFTEPPSGVSTIVVLGYSYQSLGDGRYNVVANIGGINNVDAPQFQVVMDAAGEWVSELIAASAPVPKYPLWAHQWNDVILPLYRPARGALFMIRWNGTELVHSSFAMGPDFPPRAVFGVHGNAADTWIVGDNMALRGASQ